MGGVRFTLRLGLKDVEDEDVVGNLGIRVVRLGF